MHRVARLRQAGLRRLRERGGAGATRVLRLTGAAVAAYVAADLLLSGPRPVLAALTALLIVQVTLVGTLTDTLRRIISVIVGVAIAIGFSIVVGFSAWSLGALIAASLILGQALRLGDHLLEVPISAMLVLAVGASETAASGRISETIVGAGVGLLVNLLFPPAVQTRSAGAAVQAYADDLAGLLERVGEELVDGASAEQAHGWLVEGRAIAGEVPRIDRVLTEAAKSRRLNPRAVGTADTGPDLRTGLDALEHSAVALRSLYRSIADRMREQSDDEQLYDPEVREVFAVLLRDLANALRRFGELVRAEADSAGGSREAELAQALDATREARVRLTELLLVDPRDRPDLWELHGALLAAVERVLDELDLDERRRQRERRLRESQQSTAATVAVERLKAATRAVVPDRPPWRSRR